ncbi:GTP cyclohydrolase I protein [Rhizobium phage RHph_X3_2]|nr:GTP cyclohydrolase I protein [Rhizobium phage RHph_X3_2]
MDQLSNEIIERNLTKGAISEEDFNRGVIEDIIRELFDNTPGEDPAREGIQETPARFAKAWAHWTSGYGVEPDSLLKSFEEGDYNEMVIVKDIPLYSKCEHHLADIFGTATVAYIPNGRVVGLSKLSRLVNVFARRLQVQERMTVQIADALAKSPLSPKGVGVRLKCRHMCMESRGICQQGHHTVTTALRGVLTEGQPRDEFLREAQ